MNQGYRRILQLLPTLKQVFVEEAIKRGLVDQNNPQQIAEYGHHIIRLFSDEYEIDKESYQKALLNLSSNLEEHIRKYEVALDFEPLVRAMDERTSNDVATYRHSRQPPSQMAFATFTNGLYGLRMALSSDNSVDLSPSIIDPLTLVDVGITELLKRSKKGRNLASNLELTLTNQQVVKLGLPAVLSPSPSIDPFIIKDYRELKHRTYTAHLQTKL